MDFGTTILGVTAIVLGIFTPVVMVGIILWYKSRRNELLHDTALKLAEKGQPVPAELFVDPAEPYADLRRGVVLVMLGVGVSLALFLVGMRFWAFGIIPMFMGVGYLIVWKMGSIERTSVTNPK